VNRPLFAVGVACIALGVARMLGVAGPALPGGAYGFVAVAVLAALSAGAALYRDAAGDPAPRSPSPPPTRSTPRRPGADAAHAIDDLRVVGRRADVADGRRDLHDRLHAVAVDVLVAKRDLDEATARDRLATGAWTADAAAAACFVDGPMPPLSVRDQLAALRSGDPPYAHRVRRTLAELARVEADRSDHGSGEVDRSSRDSVEADRSDRDSVDVDRSSRDSVEADRSDRDSVDVDRSSRDPVEVDR
jgi:hypothetical protein